jgi:hypothetical protein
MYNPGIQYRGDLYLNQGISALGQDVGDAIREFSQKRDETQALDTAAALKMKAIESDYPSALKEFSDQWSKWPSMSSSAKKSFLGELDVYAARQHQKVQEDLAQAQTEAIRSKQTEAATLGQFAQAYANGGVPGFSLDSTAPGSGADVLAQYAPVSEPERLRYAMRTVPGAAVAPDFPQTIRALADFIHYTNPAKDQFTKGELGRPISSLPGYSVVPTGPNSVEIKPDVNAAMEARKVMNDGVHVGYSIGGKYVPKDEFEGTPTGATYNQAFTEDGKPIPGLYTWTKGGKTGTVRMGMSLADQIQQAVDAAGGGTGGAAGTKVGAPAPAAADRVTVVSPDGKRGTIPKSKLDEALKRGFTVP